MTRTATHLHLVRPATQPHGYPRRYWSVVPALPSLRAEHAIEAQLEALLDVHDLDTALGLVNEINPRLDPGMVRDLVEASSALAHAELTGEGVGWAFEEYTSLLAAVAASVRGAG